MTRTLRHALATTALAALLAGCGPADRKAEETPPASGNAAEVNLTEADNGQDAAPDAASEGKSIIRPAVTEEEEPAPPPLEPIDRTVHFVKGSTLDDAARAALDQLLAEPALQAGGPIRLSGHTDSKGNDRDNLRTSRRRADAVRAYLVENGVAEDRITVIALGETRPIAPNAQADGSDDEAGRLRNRRVEISVALPPAPAAPMPDATATPPS